MGEFLRLAVIAAAALVAAVAVVWLTREHGRHRWALIALAVYAAASVARQASLLGTAVTYRTWFGVASALAGLAWIAAVTRRK